MEVLSLSPFRTASIVWQPRAGAHNLTVVCKATYSLKTGTSVLSEAPESLHSLDQHHDSDPRRSIHAPADLVPLKSRCDVLVVGCAYAPRGESVRTLRTRVIVGLVDKEIEVYGD